MKRLSLTNGQVSSLFLALEQLLRAGIGCADALVLLAADEPAADCRQMLEQMARRADAGASLAAAVEQSGCFPAYATALLQVAERVGKTEQTLGALARYYEERARLERQLRSGLIYPAMLLTVLLAVAVILLVWVLPIFNDVYRQLGSALTGVAGGLLALGTMLRQALPVVLLLAAAAVTAVLLPGVRRRLSDLGGDRGIRKAINSARFVQALAMAQQSGMTEPEAAALAAAVALGRSQAFRSRCEKCVAELERGASLPQALRESEFIGSADRRLLEAGRRSGKTEAVLQKLSADLLERSEELLRRALGYLEPALVAVACLLIGGVLLSVMLPLLDIMTAIG